MKARGKIPIRFHRSRIFTPKSFRSNRITLHFETVQELGGVHLYKGAQVEATSIIRDHCPRNNIWVRAIPELSVLALNTGPNLTWIHHGWC